MEDTIDEELRCWVRDANCVENLVEIIRDESISRPLRKECNRHDNAQALSIARGGYERLPTNISVNCSIEFYCSLDLLEFVLNKRIIPDLIEVASGIVAKNVV